MRWTRFHTGHEVRYGILDDERITPVLGDPFRGYEKTSERLALADVTLDVPVIPPTFYAAGLNYADHVQEMARRGNTQVQLPEHADIGYRANNALIAHGQDVIIPADAGERVQYEAEVVVVIGKKARNVAEADVPSVIFGYTIGNDVSERDWQRSDRTFWRSKNSDTFKPMGPWIDTAFDIDRATTRVQVNGELRQEFETAKMIFGISHFIARMTRYITLWPGDVVWMGTDGGSPNLRHGDLVDISITGLGQLSNRFVRAGADA
jgi:2-keto-4-pentenoate hydratase/2-oxohepta-3-ene-1,7-dioic acid hydratase in catechol pathway